MKFEFTFLLPLAAFVAIVLFVVREGLDSFRKSEERKRKLTAAKSLLAYETERNYYSKIRLFQIFKDINENTKSEATPEFTADILTTGSARYTRRRDSTSKTSYGMPIPQVHMSEFDRWLPTIAEIDKPFFESVMVMYTDIFELEHLRSSLLDFLLKEIDDEGRPMLEGFSDYALRHSKDMEKSFKTFYKACANTDDIPTRMR